ncbi:DsbA family protein [Chryseobacterium oryzae]|uniref:DsbA family protein n=1 Tax=Chryseobacterium oryzae TaxID=2929799 RepID=A0ABY4BF73_9FLAO|nr:DsbA family protein [Chryseobacterium oryzae]UOE37554.1 DsbA family protein [Chryseobacterium oryzae]
MKPTIIYVYDGLCSWCYGFEKEMQILYDKFQDRYDFQLVSGGMFPAEQNRRIKDILGEGFREAYARVIEYSGADITEKYLGGLVEKDNYQLNSEKPAQAFSAFKTYPNKSYRQIEFVTTMQSFMYGEGLNPNEDEMYHKTAEHFEIDADEFIAKMKTDAVLEDVKKDFQYAQALQVTGFPQVFLKTPQDQYYLIARGYDKEDNIAARIAEIEKQNVINE